MVDEGFGGVSGRSVCEIKAFGVALGGVVEARTYHSRGGSERQCFQGCTQLVDPGSLILQT